MQNSITVTLKIRPMSTYEPSTSRNYKDTSFQLRESFLWSKALEHKKNEIETLYQHLPTGLLWRLL